MKDLQVILCVGALLWCSNSMPQSTAATLNDSAVAQQNPEAARSRKSKWSQVSKRTIISSNKAGTMIEDTSIDDFNQSICLTAETLCYLQRGNEQLDKGDFSAAITYFDQAIKLNPRYASAFNNRGLARDHTSDRKGAESDFKTAITLNPNFACPHNNLATLKIEENDIGGAIAEFNLSISISPDSVTLDNLGCALERVGDAQGALNCFTKAIELSPNYAFAYNHRAKILGARGNYREAILDHDRVISLRPDDAAAHWQRGYSWNDVAFAKSGQSKLDRKMARKLAIQDFSRAIKLCPTFIRAYQERGFSRAAIGDYVGAVDDFSRAIRLDPTPAWNYQSRSLMRKRCGDVSGAIQDLDEAISHHTLAPLEAFSDRAILRAGTGDYRGALQDYSKACKINPENAFKKMIDQCIDLIVTAFAGANSHATRCMFFLRDLRWSGDWSALLNNRN